MERKTVFVVQHLRSKGGSENVKTIGVYSSRSEAEAAVERKRKFPGFAQFPCIVDPSHDENESGFYIDEYPLDQDQWSEGFGL